MYNWQCQVGMFRSSIQPPLWLVFLLPRVPRTEPLAYVNINCVCVRKVIVILYSKLRNGAEAEK